MDKCLKNVIAYERWYHREARQQQQQQRIITQGKLLILRSSRPILFFLFTNQIKVVDPSKKTCETLLGAGKPGLSSEEGSVKFDEPGGLCVSPDGQSLYVADTNNHAIRVIDLNTITVSQVRIVDLVISPSISCVAAVNLR